MNNFADSLILKIHSEISNFELSPPAKKERTGFFLINFDFEDVQSNWFTSVRFEKLIIAIDPALVLAIVNLRTATGPYKKAVFKNNTMALEVKLNQVNHNGSDCNAGFS